MGEAAHHPMAHRHHLELPRWVAKVLEVAAFCAALLLIIAASAVFMLATESTDGTAASREAAPTTTSPALENGSELPSAIGAGRP